MIYIVVGFALILLIDFVPLVRRRCKRAIIAFCIFFVAGLCLAFLKLFNVQVPSALLVIGYALKNIGIGYGE